jgi:hypothetical protein
VEDKEAKPAAQNQNEAHDAEIRQAAAEPSAEEKSSEKQGGRPENDAGDRVWWFGMQDCGHR